DVYQTTDGGQNWNPITGTLAGRNLDLRTVEYLPQGTGPAGAQASQNVVLVGGRNGVYRALNPNGMNNQIWTELGGNLPNAIVSDVRYNAADDVLTVATLGRGAWLLRNAAGTIDDQNVLQIVGTPGMADVIGLIRNAANPALLDVFFNSLTPTQQIPLASIRRIEIYTEDQGDVIVVNAANGVISVPDEIHVTGGDGTDDLFIEDTVGGATATQFGNRYRVSRNGEIMFINYNEVENVHPNIVVHPLLQLQDGLLHSGGWAMALARPEALGRPLPVLGNSLGTTLSGQPSGEQRVTSDPIAGTAVPSIPLSTIGHSIFQRIFETGPGALAISSIGTVITDPTALELRLEALDANPSNVTLTTTSDGFRFDMQVATTFGGKSRIDIAGVGGTVSLSGELEILADISVHLVFGIDSNGFFIDPLAVTGPEITVTNVRVGSGGTVTGRGQLGFIEVQLQDGVLQFDPSVQITVNLNDPGANPFTSVDDNLIRVDHLHAGSIAFLTTQLTGNASADDITFQGTFEVSPLGFDGTPLFSLGSVGINLVWPDITNVSGFSVNATVGPAQDVVRFLQTAADVFIDGITALAPRLNDIAGVDLLATNIPLLNRTLGEILGGDASPISYSGSQISEITDIETLEPNNEFSLVLNGVTPATAGIKTGDLVVYRGSGGEDFEGTVARVSGNTLLIQFSATRTQEPNRVDPSFQIHRGGRLGDQFRATLDSILQPSTFGFRVPTLQELLREVAGLLGIDPELINVSLTGSGSDRAVQFILPVNIDPFSFTFSEPLAIGGSLASLSMEGTFNVTIDPQLRFGFGVRLADGLSADQRFYIVADETPEFVLNVHLGYDNPVLRGTLGPIDLELTEDPSITPNDGVTIDATISINLTDPSATDDGRITVAELASSILDVFDASIDARFDIDGLKLSPLGGAFGSFTISLDGEEPDPSPGHVQSLSDLSGLLSGIEITGSFSPANFLRPGPFEVVSMLRQLIVWLADFRDADVFDVEIPFTDTTIGEAFDWTQLFIDEIYSNVISVELQSGQDIPDLIADNGGSYTLTNARFRLQIDDETPVEVTVNGTFTSLENINDPFDNTTLVGLFNIGLRDAGLGGSTMENRLVGSGKQVTRTEGRVTARIHQNAEPGIHRFVIALQPGAIAEMSRLKMTDLEAAIAALGFGPKDATYGDEDGTAAHPYTVEQTAVETQRYSAEEFFVALGALAGIPITYDPATRIYTYTFNESATYDTHIPFNFSGALGDLAGAEINGLLHLAATVGFQFTLGFNLSSAEVPRIINSSMVPVPSNGQISRNATFDVFINDEMAPIQVKLMRSATTNNSSIADLAQDLNDAFALETWNGNPLSAALVAQQAGNSLVISARDSQLGIINRLTIQSRADDPFASELGFGVEVLEIGGLRYYGSTSQSRMLGLFLENAQLTAQLQVNTETDTATYPEANANGLSGSVQFGFVEVAAANGAFGTLEYDGVTPHPITASLSLRNEATGSSRFYLPDLFEAIEQGSFLEMIDGPNFEGSFLARLGGLSININGVAIPGLLGSNPQVSLWVPDITDLDYNPDPYDGTNTGIFLTYPDLGHLLNFQSLSFTQLIQALRSLVNTLSQLNEFGFLNEKLPIIDASINDLVDYAAQLAELIDSVASQPAASLQDSIERLERDIETLFDLDPDLLDVLIDNNGLDPATLKLTGGDATHRAQTTIDPGGADNAFIIRTTANGSTWNNVNVRIVGDRVLTGNNALVQWDEQNRVLTLKMRGGETTAQTIVNAINAASTPFEALLVAGGGGTLRTTALKFSLDLTAGVADTLPLQLDLRQLAQQLAGGSGGAADFLEAVTTLIQVTGSGVLEVSASASLSVDFGLDLTNPTAPEPFFYDTTQLELLAKVLGRDINIETSLGSVIGIYVKDGEVTLDQDGDPETDATDNDRGVRFAVSLNDTNNDDRIYFSENWLSTDIIQISLMGGFSASLPIFAPTDSIPLGSTSDGNGDGHPDNVLFIGISDFAGLFNGADVVTIATPDLASLVANVDFCSVLENAGLLLDGLDGLLGSIEDGLRELVESNALPMLGDGFADAANFIQDFRNGLLASIREELASAGGSATTLLENALKKAFWNSLGPGGLDLLVNADTGAPLDPALGFQQLDITLDCTEGLVVNLRL
ncbi:MAG: hypothetical protein AB1813_19525, partial [Verrucomicrobiota bacterium]